MTNEQVQTKMNHYEKAHAKWVETYSRGYVDMGELLVAYDKMVLAKQLWLRARDIYLAEQHMAACHRDGTACLDGCDKAAS
jgi:hypothetical protein